MIKEMPRKRLVPMGKFELKKMRLPGWNVIYFIYITFVSHSGQASADTRRH